jgi:hypothetical protein
MDRKRDKISRLHVDWHRGTEKKCIATSMISGIPTAVLKATQLGPHFMLDHARKGETMNGRNAGRRGLSRESETPASVTPTNEAKSGL